MFMHFFLMSEWPSGNTSATVSKFNAYFLHITGCFHLQICAVFSLTNVPPTQFYGFFMVTFATKDVLLILGFINSAMHQPPQLNGYK